jgi:hypothetical protein
MSTSRTPSTLALALALLLSGCSATTNTSSSADSGSTPEDTGSTSQDSGSTTTDGGGDAATAQLTCGFEYDCYDGSGPVAVSVRLVPSSDGCDAFLVSVGGSSRHVQFTAAGQIVDDSDGTPVGSYQSKNGDLASLTRDTTSGNCAKQGPVSLLDCTGGFGCDPTSGAVVFGLTSAAGGTGCGAIVSPANPFYDAISFEQDGSILQNGSKAGTFLARYGGLTGMTFHGETSICKAQ